IIKLFIHFFFFQAEDGIRDFHVTGVQTCALPISAPGSRSRGKRGIQPSKNWGKASWKKVMPFTRRGSEQTLLTAMGSSVVEHLGGTTPKSSSSGSILRQGLCPRPVRGISLWGLAGSEISKTTLWL